MGSLLIDLRLLHIGVHHTVLHCTCQSATWDGSVLVKDGFVDDDVMEVGEMEDD